MRRCWTSNCDSLSYFQATMVEAHTKSILFSSRWIKYRPLEHQQQAALPLPRRQLDRKHYVLLPGLCNNRPMQKFEPVLQFLNKPPRWFALLFWFFPFVWFFVGFPITALPTQELRDRVAAYALIVGLPLTLLILVFVSSWLRNRILIMVPFWLILLNLTCDMTQGALTASITKAFSIVTAGPNETDK